MGVPPQLTVLWLPFYPEPKLKFLEVPGVGDQPCSPYLSHFLRGSPASLTKTCSHLRTFASAVPFPWNSQPAGVHMAHSLLALSGLCPNTSVSLRPSLTTHMQHPPPPAPWLALVPRGASLCDIPDSKSHFIHCTYMLASLLLEWKLKGIMVFVHLAHWCIPSSEHRVWCTVGFQ